MKGDSLTIRGGREVKEETAVLFSCLCGCGMSFSRNPIGWSGHLFYTGKAAHGICSCGHRLTLKPGGLEFCAGCGLFYHNTDTGSMSGYVELTRGKRPKAQHKHQPSLFPAMEGRDER